MMKKKKNNYQQPEVKTILLPENILQVPFGSENQIPTSLDVEYEEETEVEPKE